MRLENNRRRLAHTGSLALAFAACVLPLAGQEGTTALDVRYRIDVNQDLFPQKKPHEALKSVVKAAAEKRFGYLLAQLSLPATVDARVLRIAETYKMGSLEEKKLVAFEDVIRVTAEHFLNDPVILKELRLFAAEGEWEEKGDRASASHKDLPGRKVMFQKLENRWFLENRSKDK